MATEAEIEAAAKSLCASENQSSPDCMTIDPDDDDKEAPLWKWYAKQARDALEAAERVRAVNQ